MELYGHKPNRRSGQNFLVQPNTAAKFVDSAVLPKGIKPRHVVEIGPGVGSITKVLCERFEQVTAIEKDTRLIRLWESEIPRPENLRVVEGDATNFDFARLSKDIGERLVVFGNLPFNVSTLILTRLLTQWRHVAYAQLTFQKEVADRLVAKPGGKEYGSLTILGRIYCDVTNCMLIQKHQYYPVPKVDSRVLGFTFLEQPRAAIDDLLGFEAFVRQLFLYRRKTLLNGLKRAERFSGWGEAVRQSLNTRGLTENCRVETLDFTALYAVYLDAKNQVGSKA